MVTHSGIGIGRRLLWPLMTVGLIVGLLVAGSTLANAGEQDRAGVALFDPATGTWHLRYPDGSEHHFLYGNPGDVPLMGDWDCDGFDTVGMYRPSNGFVYVRNANGFGVADEDFFYGLAGDVALVGDWNSDGCDTLAIYRQGTVFVRNELGTGVADYSFFFGDPGDRPFSGDFDADGDSSVGLYRETTGFAYLRNSNSSGFADSEFFYGEPSDRIFIGDWDGDGSQTVGIYRPSEAAYYLSNANQTGTADMPRATSDTPATFQWPAYLAHPISPTRRLRCRRRPAPPAPRVQPVQRVQRVRPVRRPPAQRQRCRLPGRCASCRSATRLPRETPSPTPTASTCPTPTAPASISSDHGSGRSGWISARFLGSIKTTRPTGDGGRTRWLPEVDWAADDSYVPDVGLIHLGTNDLLQQQDVSSTINDIRTTINHLRDANPNVDVFVAQIIKCSCYGLRDQLNEAISGLAADMNTPQSRVVSVWMDNVEYSDLHDGIHPNNAGSEKMFWNWEAAMQSAGLL